MRFKGRRPTAAPFLLLADVGELRVRFEDAKCILRKSLVFKKDRNEQDHDRRTRTMRARVRWLISAVILALPGLAQATGDITFAEFAGTAVNTPLPSGEYDGGLPAGLAAMWNGWLFDTIGANTPVSVFVSADLPNQYYASVIFFPARYNSKPTSISPERQQCALHNWPPERSAGGHPHHRRPVHSPAIYVL